MGIPCLFHGFFLFFFFGPWGFNIKLVPSTVESSSWWPRVFLRKWWLPEMNWMICNIYIYMIYMIYVTFTKVALLIGITGPHCYFRRKVMSSTCTPVCWSVRRRWMRPKNQLGLSENKVPPFHLIVNHSSLACITLYSLSYNVCII